MNLFFERIYPYVLAAAGTIGWYRLGLSIPIGASDSLLGSSLTIGSIITGFMGTAKAILISLDSPIMKRLRETRYLFDLASYLSQAIWLSFSFSVFALVGYFIDVTRVKCEWYGLVWIFLGIASGAAFLRVISVMLKIFKHPGNDKSSSDVGG
jgi:hypothetical protein